MKIVREHINEKFTEKSDPIQDLDIGGIDLEKTYENTALKGLIDWTNFLRQFIGKRVTFTNLGSHEKMAIHVSDIGMHYQNKDYIWFFDDHKPYSKRWDVDITKKIFIIE
jgi:hypothetical protein